MIFTVIEIQDNFVCILNVVIPGHQSLEIYFGRILETMSLGHVRVVKLTF